MSLTETKDLTTQPSEALARPMLAAGDLTQEGLAGFTSPVQQPVKRALLVWDAPNLDMGLGSILGRRPTGVERPRFDALGRWLLARTTEVASEISDEPEVRIEPEATVFTNIAPGSAEVVRPWVDALRNVGFAVFAKPKIDEDSDVDRDMLEHIALRYREGLAALMVASADGQAFRLPLEEVARGGTPVQVLGFREHASWALASDSLEFVDLEDIAGVFREPLPRIGLDSLPEQGAWLQPFRPLSSLLTSRV
ncbi:NYN domain-containing protein [Mycobacterium vicinigordonae]|uniref:NYN domain-containing protein n=1 Tax=Mycobacterium vicinigordonae TaxID=1719132 RepID=A0A7D6E257_9MYCO|nr:NYN domain-containing protein [Mycobacterium vicinigordonae]QLL07901.1 NYN domain-containing protein [Mycobacterium vicinigordonae]